MSMSSRGWKYSGKISSGIWPFDVMPILPVGVTGGGVLVIYQTRQTVLDHISKLTSATCSGVFSMNLEVFGNVVKHCLDCLIYFLSRN